MEPLYAVLESRSDEVILRWKAMVQGTLAPEGMEQMELIDHLPAFLAEVIEALREDAGLSSSSASQDKISTAAEHGEQRLRLGFSLDAVVREYGALRHAIVVIGREAGASMSLRELQLVFDAIVDGIADAVSEYSRQRDAEMQRQHNEHFAFIAHELRNPLSSAMMAFEQLVRKGRIPLAERATLTVERGLKRMRELIDHSLDLARTASGVEVRTQPVKLRPLLEEAEVFASAEAENKQIDVRIGRARSRRSSRSSARSLRAA